jgi:hypothetical protein
MALAPPPDDRNEARAPARVESTGVHGPTDPTRQESSPRLPAVLQATWSTFRSQLATCIAAYWSAAAASWLIVLTCRAAFSGLNEAIGDPAVGEFLRFLLFLADKVIPIWLLVGLNRALLKIARGEPTAFDDLFRGGPYLLATILATFVVLSLAVTPALIVHFLVEMILDRAPALTPLLSALTFLSAIGAPPALTERLETVIAVELDGDALSGLLACLAGVMLLWPGILAIVARLGQFPYIILDQGAGVVDALRSSWRLTRGRFATVIAAYLAYLAINGAGLLTLCVGIIFTLPMTSLLLVMTYLALSEGPPGLVPADPEVREAEATA